MLNEGIKVNFENCYGIKKLSYDFTFSDCRVIAIYAPNGIMKTSFAKAFQDLSLQIESKDRVFTDVQTKREIFDALGQEISPKKFSLLNRIISNINLKRYPRCW